MLASKRSFVNPVFPETGRVQRSPILGLLPTGERLSDRMRHEPLRAEVTILRPILQVLLHNSGDLVNGHALWIANTSTFHLECVRHAHAESQADVVAVCACVPPQSAIRIAAAAIMYFAKCPSLVFGFKLKWRNISRKIQYMLFICAYNALTII